MKNKIKTAKQRARELLQSVGLSADRYPGDANRFAREFDNHARRAHERHARKNVCFLGYRVVTVIEGGSFVVVPYEDDTKFVKLARHK